MRTAITRKRSLLVVLWIAPLAFLKAPVAFAESAAQLASMCEPYRHAVIVQPAEGGSMINVPSPTTQGHVCWGIFAAIQEFWRLGLLTSCLPEKSSRLELVKVFIHYMDEHPEVGHEDFGPVVLRALSKAFPCPKKAAS